MNAYWLHTPDGKQTEYHACGVCHKLAMGHCNWDISERCCTCYHCGQPLLEEERRYANRVLYHRKCDSDQRAIRAAARLEKAEEIVGYDGPVYFEGVHGSFGDDYCSHVDELADNLKEGQDVEFVHCCEQSSSFSINLDSVMESAMEEMFEDAYDHLNGVEDLQKAVDVFNEANKSLVSWGVDYKHKVRVPQFMPQKEI